MINMQFVNLSSLVEEYIETVSKMEELCYWATDRLHIINKSRYELNWGVIILLVASQGKIYLLEEYAKKSNVFLDKRYIERSKKLLKDWLGYVNEFRSDVELELKEQFKRSIFNRYSGAYQARSIFLEINDLEYFFNELDTMELFFTGVCKFFEKMNLKDRVMDLDLKMKQFIFLEVLPQMKKKYSKKRLQQLLIEWLPSEFWWRHLPLT